MDYSKWLVIDVETNGLSSQTDKIVEIAAVWKSDDSYRHFSTLINPQQPIPPVVSALHHITDEDVANSPLIDGVIDRIPSGMLVAHNAKFDKSFLPQFAERDWLCTYRCALHLYPDAPAHTNMVLRYWLGLSPDVRSAGAPHRALYDAIVTTKLLERMLEGHTLQELFHLQNKPALLHHAKFGKHRGELWKNIPHSYMQWILGQKGESTFDDDVRHTCRHWLAR